MIIQFHSLVSELSKLHQTLLNTKRLHALIVKTSLSYDPFYATRLVRFYALNSDLASAHNLFDETPNRSIYLWNSIIRAYGRTHNFTEAFWLFGQMLRSETKPENFTFACILRVCSESFDFERLRLVHGGVIVSGLGLDSVSSSAIVSAYSKVGLLDEALRVFNQIPEPDLVLCNSVISGSASCGCWNKGLELFGIMRRMGIRPDGYTLVGLISGITDSELLEIGQAIHGYCIRSGFDIEDHVGSVLVSLYSRFKCMKSACKVFDSLCQPDLVTWSALITGFSQSGEYGQALHFFRRMNVEGQKADLILIASMLAATAQLTTIRAGSELHAYAVRHGYDLQVMVSSALIDMYSKCGFLELAIQVFKTMPEKNIITYNTVISCLGLYGHTSEAFELLGEMMEKGFKPDESTLSALLCACCHSGLIKEGQKYFRRMKDEFSIQPNNEHCVYMVKILGMAGELDKAYDLIQSLPGPVDSSIWGALLSCCEFYGNSELAEIVADQLFKNNPEKSKYKIMLANIYAGSGRWDDVKKLRDDIGVGKIKMPGVSWISS